VQNKIKKTSKKQAIGTASLPSVCQLHSLLYGKLMMLFTDDLPTKKIKMADFQ